MPLLGEFHSDLDHPDGRSVEGHLLPNAERSNANKSICARLRFLKRADQRVSRLFGTWAVNI